MSSILSVLLDFLYPPHCPFCGEIMPVGSKVHEKCCRALPRITGSRCEKCGKAVSDGERICEDCAKTEHIFEKGFSAFIYDGTVRDALLALKFQGKKEYAKTLGALMADEAKEFLSENKVGLLVPVPMYEKKRKQRGFNQADALAESISLSSGIPADRRCIERIRPTAAMKGLQTEERRKNLRGAFAVNKEKVCGKRICIVDDIFTTGTTADACAEVLLQNGAEAVFFLACAAGDGRA